MVDIGGVFESSRLLDWELDTAKLERDETVARSLLSYRHLKTEIQSQCAALSAQQERLDEESSVEPLTVWVMGSWGALESMKGKTDESQEYATRKRELTKKIVMLKIQVLCLKQVHVSSSVRQLQELLPSGSKTPTPTSLQFHKFEEWAQANKQIYTIQSKILDLEAAKIRLRKDFCVREDKESSGASITTRQSFTSHLELKLGLETDPSSAQQKLEEVVVSSDAVAIASILDQILDTHHLNNCFEACKLKAYIRECWDVQDIDDEFPTGVHADRYQEFVGGMAQYIVDKQLMHQRESLSYDMVYSKLEQYLMPSIHRLVQEHISKPEEDNRISQICCNLSQVTQKQFGIRPEYQDDSIAPYYSAVACLKSMSLSILPVRKIYAIVSAAQCVFRKLNELAMLEYCRPPGADEFMDVWVYVVLKSRIPNLASTVALLRKYSNPNLSFSEAGYYLASVEFACQYLLHLNEQDYSNKSPLLGERIVVCEHGMLSKLTAGEEAVFEMVSEEKWLHGYQLFAVKEWHSDPTRFYRTILVPTSDSNKKVKVSVVKVKQENTSLAQLEMLEQVFLFPNGEKGLSSVRTNCGIAVTLDVDHAVGSLTLIPIPDGQYESYKTSILNYCTLDKLSCDYTPPLRSSPVEIIDTDSVLETLQQMDSVICTIYNVPRSSRGPIQDIVSVLIPALQQLSYLSLLVDIPAIYSDLVQMAVKKFQKDFNTNNDSNIPQLPVEGLLCPETWRAIQARLEDLTKACSR